MINTTSKTLGAQEKTQDIKQSLSTKIGTKPHARSRRNKLTEVIGRWRKVTGCSDQWLSNSRRQQQRPNAEQVNQPDAPMALFISPATHSASDRTLAANRPDIGQQRPIEYREVPELQNCNRARSVAGDRTLVASDQLFVVQRLGRPDASGQ